MTDNSMFVASVGLLSSSLWRLSWFYIMTAQGGGACVLYTHTDGRNSSCFYHLLGKALTQDLCIIHLHIHYVLHVGNKSYIMSQRCTCFCSLNHLKRPKTTLSCEASLQCSYCKASRYDRPVCPSWPCVSVTMQKPGAGLCFSSSSDCSFKPDGVESEGQDFCSCYVRAQQWCLGSCNAEWQLTVTI